MTSTEQTAYRHHETDDLTLFANMAARRMIDTDATEGFVMVSGVEADIAIVPDPTRALPLSWALGVAVYPADGVYAAAVFRAEFSHNGAWWPPIVESKAPVVREAVVCWAHLLPTGESMLVMFVENAGTWDRVEATNSMNQQWFLDLQKGARASIEDPIDDLEAQSRRKARKQIAESSGGTYHAVISKPGRYLNQARASYDS